jgi:hypothetical protein
MYQDKRGVWSLGPERCKALIGCPGFSVRIQDDLRKTVVFFGFEDQTPGRGGINCIGTGFLVGYDGSGYLVTAKHLAHDLGQDPFLIRLNKRDGTSENIHADGADWAEHPDPSVDIALVPFNLSGRLPYDVMYLPFERMAAHESVDEGWIGIGDLTYTVGLFRVMAGGARNLPIVHFGSLAMIPRDEKVPLRDWRDRNRVIQVEGYLVETQALEGLSGSPVFVRASVPMSQIPPNMLVDTRHFPDGRLPASLFCLAPRQDVLLLGLWQSSWDAPAGTLLGAGNVFRVPVGMGVVVSTAKIQETLELDGLKKIRQQVKERQALERAAKPDSAIRRTDPEAPSSDDANPNHLEDFIRIVGVAARKRPQGDQT